MGLVMRDGIERLTHAKRYSRFYQTICTGIAWPGYVAGTGRLIGADPREMAKSDCVVIWGTNAVVTQVNVMTHAVRARKERGAKIVAIDIYDTETMRQADLALRLRPGTDGALACAAMHVLFRDGLADRAYLERYTDAPAELEAHLSARDPEWASAITGLDAAQIEEFAALVGRTKRTFFRLGYGFSRQRNGAANMHAALCIPAVTGAWAHEGGGAFHSNSGIFKLRKTMIEGLDVRDSSVRRLDQSRVGAILTGEKEALKGGPPVKAMLIQNTNPLAVAPHQEKVRRGFSRDDLFVCVHEQFMTDTARYADIVLAGDDVPGARRHLYRRRPSAPAVRGQGDRTAAGLPLKSRGDRRARPATRRRAPGVFHVAARDHRLDAAPIGLWRSGGARSPALARFAAAFRGGAFPRRLRLSGRKVPLQGRLGAYARRQRRVARPLAGDAEPARPLAGQRGDGRRASVQARDVPRPQLPQLELYPDPDLARA